MKKIWVVFSVILSCTGAFAVEYGEIAEEKKSWYSDIEFEKWVGFPEKKNEQSDEFFALPGNEVKDVERKENIERNKWTITAEFEKWSGFTQYEIGGTVSTSESSYNYRFPISRLKFFLNTYVVNVGVSYTPSDWSFSLNYKTNVTRTVDKMEDSDWGYFYYESKGDSAYSIDTFDVFSVSESKLVMHIVDLNADKSYFRNDLVTVRFGAGLLFQYFDYVCSNTLQWYPSYSYYKASGASIGAGYGLTYLIEGDTITYELFHLLPYFKIQLDLHYQGFGLTLCAKLAPLSYLRDVDDHLVRNKESTSNDLAYSVLGEGAVSYTFMDVTVAFTGECMVLGSQGRQEQVSSSGTATIEHRTYYWQYSFGVRVSYSF